MKTVKFLRLLFGEDAPGFLTIWTRQDRQAHWLPAGDLEAAGRLAEQLAGIYDLYCGVALQDKEAAVAKWRRESPDVRGEPTTRGYSETTIALPGLWVDVDVRSPAHKATNLPPTKAAALSLIREFPLTPTIVVDSGYGLHGWWLFRELWVFDNEADQRAAKILTRRFLATLQARARAHGWQIDPTADLARVLRLPGTFNHKLEPLPVQVIEEVL
jgi:putative DNA primase/helicase